MLKESNKPNNLTRIMASTLRIADVSKRFSGRTILDGINLEIKAGEFFSLVGPSGCGKSTLLRLIAGLDHPTSGHVYINEEESTSLPPQERNIGLVFQNYALFPNMSVSENVAFGLEVKRLPREQIKRRVSAILEKVNLLPLASKPVTQLSGGEQQRVSLARVLVTEPGLLLFDEPLSNLDVTMRIQARKEIQRLHHDVGITSLFVTHDQNDALALSDRVAVLAQGKLQQFGQPEDIYQNPCNEFVARFIGGANLFNDQIRHKLDLVPYKAGYQLVVLPEDLRLVASQGGLATITGRQFQGQFIEYIISVDKQEFRSRYLHHDMPFSIGQSVGVELMNQTPVFIRSDEKASSVLAS